MSLALLALILCAAILHATWNFFAKRSGGGLAVLWLGAAISTLATIPAALAAQWGKPVPPDGLAIGCLSGLVHCAYWWALARMYEHGDISLAYPVARGSGVAGTAVGSLLWLHEPLSFAGATGIALVCIGVIVLGFQRRVEPVRTRVILLALITGLTITGYSLLDDRGVETMAPPTYLAVETGVGAAALFVFMHRRLYTTLLSSYRRHWKTAWIIGVGSPLTYLIILFAYAAGPVGYITAVREFSVVIAALLGVWFLNERMSPARWAGIALVVTGMVLIKVA
jgi:drug/metabolite transporter (DMT)-like permease